MEMDQQSARQWLVTISGAHVGPDPIAELLAAASCE